METSFRDALEEGVLGQWSGVDRIVKSEPHAGDLVSLQADVDMCTPLSCSVKLSVASELR